jgi:hypothetical protein
MPHARAPPTKAPQGGSSPSSKPRIRFQTIATAQEWLAHPHCRRYHDIGFYSHLQPTPEQLPPTTYNLFRGFEIPRNKAHAGDVEPLLRHVKDVLCNGDETHSEFLFNSLAQIIQTPCCAAAVMQAGWGFDTSSAPAQAIFLLHAGLPGG